MGSGQPGESAGMNRLKEFLRVLPTEVAAHARKNAWQILGLALLVLLVHDIFGSHGIVAMRRTQKEIDQIRAQIAKINDENKLLNGQVISLKTDPKAIEHIAREEMGLARPGELIFKIPDAANTNDSQGHNPHK
jgi:cell division protein FtsB